MKENVIRIAHARRLVASGEARRLREAARLSQSEVARAIGVSHTAIHRWEAGSRQPRGAAAVRYARLLDKLAGLRLVGDAEGPGP